MLKTVVEGGGESGLLISISTIASPPLVLKILREIEAPEIGFLKKSVKLSSVPKNIMANAPEYSR